MGISMTIRGTAAMGHDNALRVIYARDDYEGVAITAPKSSSPVDSVPDRETEGLGGVGVTWGQLNYGMFDHDLVEDMGEDGDGSNAFLDGNTPAGRVNWGEPRRSVEELMAEEQVSAELTWRARMRQPNTAENQRRKIRERSVQRERAKAANGRRFLILEEILPGGVVRRRRIPMQFRIRQVTPTVAVRRPIAPSGAVIPVTALQSIAAVAG